MGLVDFSLDSVGSIFKDVREAITGKKIEDPQKKAEIELKLKQLEQAINRGQIETNKIEAQNNNLFVSGWRPFLGWVGGFSIAYTYILSPFLHSFFYVMDINFPLPAIDTGLLFNLVLALLGFGGMRTYEKLKKVQNLH